jgi:hypothetical protein
MTDLEEVNPSLIFVYMTNNAQTDGSQGYNRWLRNEQIRQYCHENDKVLFDFADLDCWSNGENNSYEYTVGDETYDIPVEHSDFNGNEAGHTTYSSCEQKGHAFWWLMATLAGWNSAPMATTTSSIITTTTSSDTSSLLTTTTSDDVFQFLSSVASFGVGLVIILIVIVLLYRRR